MYYIVIMKSILLLGHSGYLGSFINVQLQCDILDKSREIYDNGKQYDYVINCIGKPNLEYCELNQEETNYSNCDVILDIHKLYPSAKIINFSSYYVYDSDGLCSETSTTTDKYNYCRQKLQGEKYVNDFGGINFRIGKLFGSLDINKQNKLTEHIIKSNELELDSVIFNPTSLKQVLDVVKWEIENNKLFGIYNLSNQHHISHYNWGLYINYFLDFHKKLTKLEKINRSFHNYGKFTMSIEKLNKVIPLRGWEEDLCEYLKQIKK